MYEEGSVLAYVLLLCLADAFLLSLRLCDRFSRLGGGERLGLRDRLLGLWLLDRFL